MSGLRGTVSALALVLVIAAVEPAVAARSPTAGDADAALDRALQALVRTRGGPSGAISIVQRGGEVAVHAAGAARRGAAGPPRANDHMKIASVAKAFSGGAALALVQRGVLGLDQTIGQRLPDLPTAWHAVTLRELLNHTSGLPEFLDSPEAQKAINASPGKAPPPRRLLAFVEDEPLRFPPGSEYRYSNSDNVAVGLMVQAATGRSYERELRALVLAPLGLNRTSLPRGPGLPRPFMHGYAPDQPRAPEDVSTLLAGDWPWASGGIVSTPADLNRFFRGYLGGRLFGPAVRAQQRRFVPGGSEPTGPGANAAGLALFRYSTSCGVVYGHTGNTLGYTQFAAASRDGSRSATLSITAQLTPGNAPTVYRKVRRTEELAVCAALAR
ncbi:MAG TPA: serine hydrolase domain-containing protein [Miltoncostaeaceae bacterium]|nr:serine hydrolase domain-containing protein [Miltoncostaeaceae bacterium]